MLNTDRNSVSANVRSTYPPDLPRYFRAFSRAVEAVLATSCCKHIIFCTKLICSNRLRTAFSFLLELTNCFALFSHLSADTGSFVSFCSWIAASAISTVRRLIRLIQRSLFDRTEALLSDAAAADSAASARHLATGQRRDCRACRAAWL